MKQFLYTWKVTEQRQPHIFGNIATGSIRDRRPSKYYKPSGRVHSTSTQRQNESAYSPNLVHSKGFSWMQRKWTLLGEEQNIVLHFSQTATVENQVD